MHEACKKFIHARDNGLLRTKMTKQEREKAIDNCLDSILNLISDNARKYALNNYAAFRDNNGYDHPVYLKLTKKGYIVLKNEYTIASQLGIDSVLDYVKERRMYAFDSAHAYIIIEKVDFHHEYPYIYKVRAKKEYLKEALMLFCAVFDHEIEPVPPLSYDTN